MQRCDASARGAHAENRRDSTFAHISDRRQPEAHALGRHRERELALVNVGRQHRNAALARLGEIHRQLVGVLRLDRQQRGSKVPRVIRFQVRRLIGKQRVRRRMRLIETVPREVLHQVEDLRGFLFVDAPLHGAFDELLPLRLHDVGFFLPHRLAQQVGFAQREAGEHARDAHHLFLIRNDAVRVGEDRLEFLHLVAHLHLAVLAGDEVVDHPAAQRAGTIERVQRDEIVEALRLGLAQNVAHTRTFKLEDTVGLTVGKDLIRLRIVERNRIEIDDRAGRRADFLDRIVQQRERAETEEVHLEQADALDFLHGPLGRDFVVLAFVERREIGDGSRRNHHAGGVHRGVAGHALEAAGHRQQFLHAGVLFARLFQRRHFFERLVERHVERGRNELGHAIDIGKRNVERPAHVAHDGSCLHRPERDDLRHVLAAIFLRDVLDDLAAPALAEIDVDIGQRHALGIQEALEDQVVIQRIDVRDAQAVGHEAPGRRAAARTDGNALLARVPDEVPDDHEVSRILHPLDHFDFVRETLFVLLYRMAERASGIERTKARQALSKSFANHVLEIIVQRVGRGNGEVRQVILVARNVDVAAFGDANRVR